jgi:hypothetical protein
MKVKIIIKIFSRVLLPDPDADPGSKFFFLHPDPDPARIHSIRKKNPKDNVQNRILHKISRNQSRKKSSVAMECTTFQLCFFPKISVTKSINKRYKNWGYIPA